jgi:hypothetical protein
VILICALLLCDVTAYNDNSSLNKSYGNEDDRVNGYDDNDRSNVRDVLNICVGLRLGMNTFTSELPMVTINAVSDAFIFGPVIVIAVLVGTFLPIVTLVGGNVGGGNGDGVIGVYDRFAYDACIPSTLIAPYVY